MPLDGPDALIVVARLACVGMAISTLELLVRPATLRDTGLSSWRVSRLAGGWLSSRRVQGGLGWILEYPRVRGLLVLRLLLTAVVFLAAWGPFVTGLAAVGVGVLSSLLVIRCSYGHDGADQMLILIFYAVGIAHLRWTPVAVAAALWFIALQTCLAYFSAGLAKLWSPQWRQGTALPGILGTDIYGHRWVRRYVERGTLLAVAGCWTTIGFECLFPLSVYRWPSLTVALLATGVAFHLGNAFVMRLNTFLWAFCATYPAVWYCASRIREAAVG